MFFFQIVFFQYDINTDTSYLIMISGHFYLEFFHLMPKNIQINFHFNISK